MKFLNRYFALWRAWLQRRRQSLSRRQLFGALAGLGALLLLLLVYFLVANYQANRDARTAAALLGRSGMTLGRQEQPRLRYRLQTTARAELAADADPLLRLQLDKPLHLDSVGALALDASYGQVRSDLFASQQELSFRGGLDQFYLLYLGAWYGDPERGLRGSAQRWEQGRYDFARESERLGRIGSKALDVEIEEGPLIQGQPTWKISGTLDGRGAAQLAQAEGYPISFERRARFGRLLKDTQVELLIGKKDHLPRLLQVRVDGDPRLWLPKRERRLQAITHLQVDIRLQLDSWGQPVHYRAPDNFRDLQQLQQLAAPLLLGLLDGSGPARP